MGSGGMAIFTRRHLCLPQRTIVSHAKTGQIVFWYPGRHAAVQKMWKPLEPTLGEPSGAHAKQRCLESLVGRRSQRHQSKQQQARIQLRRSVRDLRPRLQPVRDQAAVSMDDDGHIVDRCSNGVVHAITLVRLVLQMLLARQADAQGHVV